MQSPDITAEAAPDDDDRLRAGTWALLAALLRQPPDIALLHSLAGIAGIGAQEGGGALGAAWAGLRAAALRAVPAAVDDEYHVLFIGIGRGELVPFASWYLTGFLMEKPLGELRADLVRLGFERQPGICEPEDHIAALAEVLGLLIGEGACSAQAAQAFYARHVEPWAGRFFADLEVAAAADFYRAVGRLGAAYTDFERQYGAMPLAPSLARSG